MNPTSLAEYAVFLWAITAGVALLTAHVGLGWLARARRRPELARSWPAQLLSAATLGTGVCATAILGLTAEELNFPLGYGSVAAAVLWLGSVIACLPLVAALTASSHGAAVLLGCALLAAVGTGIQMGWIWAAGLRPGVLWDLPVVGGAMTLMGVGMLGAFWMAVKARESRSHEPKSLSRLGSTLLLGLSLVVGQQLVLAGSDLSSQQGSVYRNQLPNSLLSLGCAALMPITLLIMALDLSFRRDKSQRRRAAASFNPQRRRKHREGGEGRGHRDRRDLDPPA
jgi:NO-binding membrane sensor protein with MHYT domain